MGNRFQTALTALCLLALIGHWITGQAGLAYASVGFGSVFALQSGWQALVSRRLDVNILMILAAVGAVVLGHPAEAAVLLFLFSLSNTLEAYTLGRTESAIEGLVKLRPDDAWLITDAGEVKTPLAQIQIGDLVRVRPYENIPVDGTVTEGRGEVNQASLTGESQPVTKLPGDELWAGTQNQGSALVIQVTKAMGDTTLERVVTLVREAQENKASGERVSQWFGERYTVFVMVVFALSIGIRVGIGQEWGRAAHASLNLLVALSPCALVISTPATMLSALAWAARHGILVRGGQALEAAAEVDTVAMDKTGTLTAGKFALKEICVCAPAMAVTGATCREGDVCWHGGELSTEAGHALALAAAAEQFSPHPLATAIVAAAKTNGLEVPVAEESEVVSGLGVRARVKDEVVTIGQPRFFTDLPAEFRDHADRMRAKGLTVAVMQVGDGARAQYVALGLRDEPRPQAASALKSLRAAGISRIVMLTGDTPQTAGAVAADLNLDEVKAGLMPDDKLRWIEAQSAEGRKVMMVGDGVNDAPSLARAHVGVAMGGLGSDVALNAADAVLMHDNLERIAQLVQLGRKARRIITANLVFAGSVVVVLTLGLMILDAVAPQLRGSLLPIAVVGHEGSTVLVILNGLRLLRGP